jgi:hypothetical protein
MNVQIIILLLPCCWSFAAQYSTTFPVSENPVSEGGKWVNGQSDGLLWANCMTTNGMIWGSDNRGVAYADPTALLTGTWGSNQIVTATVKIINQRASGCCSEIELRLRSFIAANTNRGYEVLFSTVTGNDYVQIVTWHGPRGVQGVGFDYVNTTSGHGAPVNGDVVSASISNSTIRVYKNGSLILTGVNTEWSNGKPGVGFYGDTAPNVGFSQFSATDGIPTLRASPTNQTSLLLAWPTNDPGFVPHSAPALPALSPWTVVTDSPAISDGEYRLLLPATNPQQYYRLQKPAP